MLRGLPRHKEASVTSPTRSPRPIRSELFGLRLRPDEAEKVRQLASAWDCTASEVVRRAVLREIHTR
jgi:hypothetical protein